MEKKDELQKCEKIFVSWAWLVGIIIGWVVIACGIAFSYSERETRQESRIEKAESDIQAVQGISNDLDTIKTMLRKK